MNQDSIRRLLASPVAGLVLLVGAGVVLCATGIAGVGRSDHEEVPDVAFFHAAGACWRQGKSPYDVKTLMETSRGVTNVGDAGIAYPPQSSSLFLPLSLLSPRAARNLWIVLGVASALLLAWLCAGPLRRPAPGAESAPSPDSRWLIAAIVLGNPFVSHALWKGASSLVAAALLIAAWTCIQRDRWRLGGILLGAATFKPQLALVPVLWLLLERRWRVLILGAATALILSIPAFWVGGIPGSYLDWFSALRYAESRSQLDGVWSTMGLRQLLLTAGISVPDLLPLAVIATFALWWFRSRIAPQDQFPLLMGIAFQFIYLHDVDLVALSPIVPAFFRHLRGKAAGWAAFALMVVVFLPQRFLRDPQFPLLAYLRIPALLALVAWLLVLSFRESRGRPLPGTVLPQASPS